MHRQQVACSHAVNSGNCTAQSRTFVKCQSSNVLNCAVQRLTSMFDFCICTHCSHEVCPWQKDALMRRETAPECSAVAKVLELK
jgi:hypothetical protein